MGEQSNPTEVLSFRGAYGDLWRHYLAGRDIAPLATLQQAPLDYWQLVYKVDDEHAFLTDLQAAMTHNPTQAGVLLASLPDLFAVEDYGLDVAPDAIFFPTNMFTHVIAPMCAAGAMPKALLGYIQLNMLLVVLRSLHNHLEQGRVTPYCFQVAQSPVYHTVMRKLGELVGPATVTL